MKKFWAKYHFLLLVGILAFAFFSRLYQLNVPENYIFDEVYHVPTAKLMALNDPRAFEWWHPPTEPNTAIDWLHPPLAKYSQAIAIRVFGVNSFAWRISSVLFGVGVIILVYKLAHLLFKNKNLSLLAALLASLDGLLLTQSRIAMNDIHVTFFILLTLVFYLKFRKKTSGKLLLMTAFAAGLAMSSKWSGVFVLIPILLTEILSFSKKNIFNILIFLLVPPIVYISSYAQMFAQGKSLICLQKANITNTCYFEKVKLGPWQWEGYISHFAMLHRQIWLYQTHLEATHSYQSRPGQWFLNLRPVWFYVKYAPEQIANIYAQGNTTLFWAGDLTVGLTCLGLLWQSLGVLSTKWRGIQVKWSRNLKGEAFLLVSYFSVWILWQFSPRIMFFYHYTPAVPLLCIILAYWLNKFPKLIWPVLLVIALNFILFYPNWTGLMVSSNWAKQIYFALKAWK